jgi:hypothetical protein
MRANITGRPATPEEMREIIARQRAASAHLTLEERKALMLTRADQAREFVRRNAPWAHIVPSGESEVVKALAVPWREKKRE